MNRRFLRLSALLLSCFLLLSAISVCAAPEPDADLLLAEMTLEEKIAQMLMPSFQTWTDADGSGYVTSLPDGIADAIRQFGFGGVALFADNLDGTVAGAALTADLQAAALDSANGIPMLIAADQEGGYVTRLGTGCTLCGNMALGASGDPDTTFAAAALMGRELDAMGVNVDFGPVMDVNSNPANPIIGVRSFSDDPALAAVMGTAYIKGMHDSGVAAALKHFPGHGDTAVDSHTGLPCIDKSLSELLECELVPFRAGIEAGADMVMTAHIQFPQVETDTYRSKQDGRDITLPATLSYTIITGILRETLGFDGVVSTDAMTMDAIAAHFDRMDAARLAINAGVDVLLMPLSLSSDSAVSDCRDYVNGIADMVRDGRISKSRIDESVLRILRLKFERGLFSRSYDRDTQIARALETVGSKANHDAERAITEKTVTLVKNDGMLPLDIRENGRVCFFCSYSNEVPAIEYALERLKSEGLLPESAECSVICYQDRSAGEFRELIGKADAVVASVETYKEANLTDGFQAAFLDSLIDLTHEYGKQVAILSIHLPYDLARYQAADALLAAYCAKGMAEMPAEFDGETKTFGPNLPAAVESLFGAFVPSATLPVNIPKLDSAGHFTDEILYARGYGLMHFGYTFELLPASLRGARPGMKLQPVMKRSSAWKTIHSAPVWD